MPTPLETATARLAEFRAQHLDDPSPPLAIEHIDVILARLEETRDVVMIERLG